MPLELKSVNVISRGTLRAVYELTHSTPGREGTCLEESLVLEIFPDGRTQCLLHIDDCKGDTPNVALDRMATWLRRLADGIENRGASVQIPLS